MGLGRPWAGGTGFAVWRKKGGENVLQLRFGQPAEGSVRSYSAGAHLQRTGETIAPSSFNAFMALSTSFRSKPLSSAIFPAFRGVPASFIVFNTISLAFIMVVSEVQCNVPIGTYAFNVVGI